VSTSANGDDEIFFAAEFYGCDDVRYVRATRNHTRAFIDHAVVERSRLVKDAID
jgi:hypothetical protein